MGLNDKRERLTEAVAEIRKEVTDETIRELMIASMNAFRQGDGLAWSDAEKIIQGEAFKPEVQCKLCDEKMTDGYERVNIRGKEVVICFKCSIRVLDS